MNQQPLFEVQILPIPEYRCPKCGSTDLRVQVTIVCSVERSPDGRQIPVQNDFDIGEDIYDEDIMLCNDCEHDAVASDFLVDED